VTRRRRWIRDWLLWGLLPAAVLVLLAALMIYCGDSWDPAAVEWRR